MSLSKAELDSTPQIPESEDVNSQGPSWSPSWLRMLRQNLPLPSKSTTLGFLTGFGLGGFVTGNLLWASVGGIIGARYGKFFPH